MKSNISYCRIFSPLIDILPHLDLLGRTFLHCKHHASLRHQRGQIPELGLSYEIWTQQNNETSHHQNRNRLDPKHRHEPSTVFYVFCGKIASLMSHDLATNYAIEKKTTAQNYAAFENAKLAACRNRASRFTEIQRRH